MAAAAAAAQAPYPNTRSMAKIKLAKIPPSDLTFPLDVDASTIESLVEKHSTVFIRAGVAAGACLSQTCIVCSYIHC